AELCLHGAKSGFVALELHWIVSAVGLADQIDARQQLRLSRRDLIARSVLAEQRRDHVRILERGLAKCVVARCRDLRPYSRQHQIFRRMADEALVVGAVGLQRAFVLLPLSVRRLQPGFGLRNVGACDEARTELSLSLIECLLQHLLAVAIEIDYRLVAQNVEIGRGDAEQYAAFDGDQMSAFGFDRVLGRGSLSDGLAALIDRLDQLEIEGTRRVVAFGLLRAGGRRVLELLLADGAVKLQRRPPAG